jgi:membrane protease YdiL (CAAX protease family)
MVLVGLVWAAGGFAFGYLRLCPGSVWAAANAHSAHNAAWGPLGDGQNTS